MEKERTPAQHMALFRKCLFCLKMARRRDATLITKPSPRRQTNRKCGSARVKYNVEGEQHVMLTTTDIFLLQVFSPHIHLFFPINPKHVSSSIISSFILKFQPHFPSVIGEKSSCEIIVSVAVIALAANRCALKC